MTTAGDLKHRIRFEARRADAAGDRTGPVEPQFTAAAQIIPRLGGETVVGQRLQGVQPVTIRVRRSRSSIQIDTDWGVVNARPPAARYEIKSVVDDPDRDGQWVDMLCEVRRGEQD